MWRTDEMGLLADHRFNSGLSLCINSNLCMLTTSKLAKAIKWKYLGGSLQAWHLAGLHNCEYGRRLKLIIPGCDANKDITLDQANSNRTERSLWQWNPMMPRTLLATDQALKITDGWWVRGHECRWYKLEGRRTCFAQGNAAADDAINISLKQEAIKVDITDEIR